MIYRNNYFTKEFRQGYIGSKESLKKNFQFGVFIGILSFGIHFFLQTLHETILTEKIPQIMLPSYFSILTLYNFLAFIYFIIYYIANYEYVSFDEIRNNKWYFLNKMGFSTSGLISGKISALLFSVFFTYFIGFLTSIFFTLFLKYPFVYAYFVPLFIVGIIDILFIIFLSLVASLIFINKSFLKYFIFISVLLMFLMKFNSQYYKTISNRNLMQDFSHLFKTENFKYFIAIISLIILCRIFIQIRASKLIKYVYSEYNYSSDIYVRHLNNSIKYKPLKMRTHTNKIINVLINIFMSVILLTAFLLNAIVLLVSVSSPGKEITLNGIIPYVFQSSTISPSIEKNDLAFFKKVTDKNNIKIDDIVLFKKNGYYYVERIKTIEDEKITVDIDNYPPMSEPNSMKKVIEKDDIYGIHANNNRWLGALILFANTFLGRLLFFILPLILLFFYKSITGRVKKALERSTVL